LSIWSWFLNRVSSYNGRDERSFLERIAAA
jgi:hypothetical protein